MFISYKYPSHSWKSLGIFYLFLESGVVLIDLEISDFWNVVLSWCIILTVVFCIFVLGIVLWFFKNCFFGTYFVQMIYLYSKQPYYRVHKFNRLHRIFLKIWRNATYQKWEKVTLNNDAAYMWNLKKRKSI